MLDIWDYYLNEDLKHGPSYDVEVIQMDSQQEEEAEAADGIINKSRKITTLGSETFFTCLLFATLLLLDLFSNFK